MNTEKPSPLAKSAIHTMAEIKAVTEAFDRGETNVFDALDAVMLAIAAYRAAEQSRVGCTSGSNPASGSERERRFCRLKGRQGPQGADSRTRPQESVTMGKGNNSQKNDKKSMKPKQDKSKPAVKK